MMPPRTSRGTRSKPISSDERLSRKNRRAEAWNSALAKVTSAMARPRAFDVDQLVSARAGQCCPAAVATRLGWYTQNTYPRCEPGPILDSMEVGRHLRRKSVEQVPRRITIRDVARAAGVGVGTISRVLNSSPNVSGEMRTRALEAMKRLGFRPNALARRVLRRRSEMVCFLLSNRDFLHPFHARILQGVESYASAVKQHVLFAALHYASRMAPERIDLPPVLQEHGLIDGVILAGTVYPNLLSKIRSIHMPCVVFSNNVIGLGGEGCFDAVGFDDFNGTLRATRHVIEMGHRRIAFCGDISYPWIHRRFDGYREGMREGKLKPVLATARYS